MFNATFFASWRLAKKKQTPSYWPAWCHTHLVWHGPLFWTLKLVWQSSQFEDLRCLYPWFSSTSRLSGNISLDSSSSIQAPRTLPKQSSEWTQIYWILPLSMDQWLVRIPDHPSWHNWTPLRLKPMSNRSNRWHLTSHHVHWSTEAATRLGEEGSSWSSCERDLKDEDWKEDYKSLILLYRRSTYSTSALFLHGLLFNFTIAKAPARYSPPQKSNENTSLVPGVVQLAVAHVLREKSDGQSSVSHMRCRESNKSDPTRSYQSTIWSIYYEVLSDGVSYSFLKQERRFTFGLHALAAVWVSL